jgi:hypothetical protein
MAAQRLAKKLRDLRKKVARDEKAWEQYMKTVDSNPIICRANHLLGDDEALDRMSLEDQHKYGVYSMLNKSIPWVSKLTAKLMGYKYGVQIKKLNTKPNTNNLLSCDGNVFTDRRVITAVSKNGKLTLDRSINVGGSWLTVVTPEDLVDGEWIVDA